MTDAPKSALELVMERLRKKDAESGVAEQKLSDEQKAAIADARSVYEARVAERQILQREPRPCRARSAGTRGARGAIPPRYRSLCVRSRRQDPEDSGTGRAIVTRRWRSRLATSATFAVSASLLSARAPEILGSIRQEGLDRSQVQAMFATLTDQFGPRLTGTPAHKQAAEWAAERLRAFGLTDTSLEPWRFGRGWVLDRLEVELVEPRYMPLIGYAEAWSPSTPREIVGTPVMIGGRSPADVQAMRDRLRGAIVLSQTPTRVHPCGSSAAHVVRRARQDRRAANPGTRPSAADTRAIGLTLHDAGAGVIVRTSPGEHGTVFVLGRDQGDAAVPTVVLAGEHYNMIARMLERGMPVKLRVNVQTHFVTDDPNSYNVVADSSWHRCNSEGRGRPARGASRFLAHRDGRVRQR